MDSNATPAPRIWLVEHPTHRYVEDVKAEARRAGLVVLDAAVASEQEIADAVAAKDAPKLTLKPEYRSSTKPAKPVQAEG